MKRPGRSNNSHDFVPEIFSYCTKQAEKIIALLLYILIPVVAFTQPKNSGEKFRIPVENKIFISGTFGEPRPDHMHSGIDFSAKNEKDVNVFAIAGGYVSRIKVSATGYGKVIYITHPGGYVSVYAHLAAFNVLIDDYVIRKQYEKESYEIELFPDPALFRIRKGDIVGYAGNTGSSTGPHLHFELRREKTERPLNPAIFGIYDNDVLPPVISDLRVYPYGETSTVNGKTSTANFKIDKKSDQRNIVLADTVKISGACYFGILAEDYVSGKNSTGLYSVKMFVDSTEYFSFVADSFAFDENRYVNDLIDYAEYTNSRDRYLMLRKSPGNKLSMYGDLQNRGILCFDENKTRQIKICIKDFSNNQTTLKFNVLGHTAMNDTSSKKNAKKENVFKFDRINHFEAKNIILDFPAYCLYDSILFHYSSHSDKTAQFSQIHSIHNKYVPLHRAFTISISADSVPEQFRSRAVIVRDKDEGLHTSIGGEIKGKYIQAKAMRFGDYFIMIDTTAPRIKAMNFKNEHSIAKNENLTLKMTDDLSGILNYRAEINGNWVYMEYDEKNDLLIIPLNEKIPLGKFELLLKAEDKCHNIFMTKFQLNR